MIEVFSSSESDTDSTALRIKKLARASWRLSDKEAMKIHQVAEVSKEVGRSGFRTAVALTDGSLMAQSFSSDCTPKRVYARETVHTPGAEA